MSLTINFITVTNYMFMASAIYLVWILIHYISAHLYVQFCTPLSFTGFLMSPFVVSAPHCRALRWSINNGASSIDAMWILLGTWMCSKLIIHKPIIVEDD